MCAWLIACAIFLSFCVVTVCRDYPSWFLSFFLSFCAIGPADRGRREAPFLCAGSRCCRVGSSCLPTARLRAVRGRDSASRRLAAGGLAGFGQASGCQAACWSGQASQRSTRCFAMCLPSRLIVLRSSLASPLAWHRSGSDAGFFRALRVATFSGWLLLIGGFPPFRPLGRFF